MKRTVYEVILFEVILFLKER